ncbi:DUF4305 domain-containing protein [Cytobacillus horneckiae]|uniref:DUF4305 domain-containing protein n=1 Tax=Cytobacillus horneckiae TaxID=549687 RepID=UPI001562DADD|nr:YdiK family protein [Bacillus sp. CRN 9]
MRRIPLFSGIFYLLFGIIFIYFAILNLQINGEWGFFTYLLLIIATFDIGGGIKMIGLHFRIKKMQEKK